MLHEAFQNRTIRIRLYGFRLPDPYVLNLRLTKPEDAAGRARKPKTRRRCVQETLLETGDDDEGSGREDVPASNEKTLGYQGLSAMEREIRELEDDQVRRTNAYPGAPNAVGSIHQPRRYLSLGRSACGFIKTQSTSRSTRQPAPDVHHAGGRKARDQSSGQLSYPFYICGVDHERSNVTGRRGVDPLNDEGVRDFVPVLN